jgi:hypothetical protein
LFYPLVLSQPPQAIKKAILLGLAGFAWCALGEEYAGVFMAGK